MLKKENCVEILLSKREEILTYLHEVISNVNVDYSTFGKEIEPYLIEKIIEIYRNAGVIKSNKDYKVAKDKNEFPDFTLLSTESPLAIEIKAGNHSKKDKGKWKKCKNSENDMGTINSWPKKLKDFGGEWIYYIFIEYDFNDQYKKVVDIKIAPFYEFLDLNSTKMLKYREKDGNLRPKDFQAVSPIKSLKVFEELLAKTAIYRSKRIIIKHLNQLTTEERYEVLKEVARKENYVLEKKR